MFILKNTILAERHKNRKAEMLSLTFGLTAALIWAVHDLLARKLSQGAALLPIVLIVLASGSLAVLGPALALGDWSAMTSAAWGIATSAGLAFAVAMGSLYRAFSLAPVRLVAPVIGSYPLLSLLIAVFQGRSVSGMDWLAVLAIVTGIAIVALTTREDAPDGSAASQRTAVGWAALSATGFALTFALSQEATRIGAELPTILIARVVALICILALAVMHRSSVGQLRRHWPILALMGLFDAIALGLVTAAGGLPRAEYASVASSTFGVLTVLLATWFLAEKVRVVQWAGIATVFCGIALLSFQG